MVGTRVQKHPPPNHQLNTGKIMTSNIVPDFPFVPTDKKSMVNKKPLYGIGINDANYLTSARFGDKKIKCHFYSSWAAMITRCYSDNHKKRCPTYKGCTVAEEWHLFSNFRAWMIKQDWYGKQLDKDILVPGNKIYSPATCIFVSPFINSLLGDSKAIRGKYPQGVTWHNQHGRFRATIKLIGKSKHVGYFDTPGEASKAYKKAKANEIIRVAGEQSDPVLRFALARHAILMAN